MEKQEDKSKEIVGRKLRLGEILVKSGLINKEQLLQVLKRQTQVGGQLGSILIDMGFITIEQLLNFLSKKLGVQGVNLFEMDIDAKVLNLLPREKINSAKVLPIFCDDTTVTLAMVNPQDLIIISEIEFMLGKKVQANVVPSFMMDAAIKSLPSRPGDSLSGEAIRQMTQIEIAQLEDIPDLLPFLQDLSKKGASDILLTSGAPPSIRLNNKLVRLSMASLTPVDCERFARELIPYNDWDDFIKTNEFDFAVSFQDVGRFRVNAYKQRNSISIAIRPLVNSVASLTDLNLPGWIKDFVFKPQGLILVSGPAGHGKTTTLGSMLDIINTHRKCNIITFEDPIEILHKHKMSNINQREIGTDTDSFITGMKHVFRQNPDVIVIGEMRDKETFEMALQAADTGHLVLSSIHSDSSTSLFDRVINMFEPYRQNLIRMMLADSLLLVLSQRLIPRKNGQGRILGLETLVNTQRIKNLIKEKNTAQIRSQMQAGTDEFESIDIAISKLYKQGLITFEDGLVFIDDEQFYRDLTGVR